MKSLTKIKGRKNRLKNKAQENPKINYRKKNNFFQESLQEGNRKKMLKSTN